ncbi:Glutamyl-tRNA reductase [Trichinella spiralis]|uniref:Glutamyl-tRNA reductase n=2 Tax=Trichinella TaxID=6333 RepID=A0ABR3KH87_TRISP
MQWSENKSDQLIDNSPSLDSRLRERAVEIGSRLKLVADQMDKDRRGTIRTVVEQYWAADWLETRDAVSGQQWSTVSLDKRDKKSSDWPGSENKCRPLSPAPPHRPD